MKNVLSKVKNSRGYISIETIVVAGLVIGIGVVSFMAFQGKANTITTKSLNQVEKATTDMNVTDVK